MKYFLNYARAESTVGKYENHCGVACQIFTIRKMFIFEVEIDP